MDIGILSRYADVAAALRNPALLPVTALVPVTALGAAPVAAIDKAVHAEFRAQALQALSPSAIEQWMEKLAALADLFARQLPTGCSVDLIERYANPWSLEVAAVAADVPADARARLVELARCVFHSAGEPYDEALSAAAQTATVELSTFFRAAPPWTVQMFVALAHTLPAFLGNAWLALAEQRVEVTDIPAAIEELLRLAGPAKAQFRAMENGQHVILRLDLANRDPERFPDPHTLRFDGRASGHLAFGAGPHACVGAALIRSAAAVATKALLSRYRFGAHYTASRVDGFAMQYLNSLEVTLEPRASGPALCL